jgi:uncharacterized membrane protein YbhN (UPF0104 family)
VKPAQRAVIQRTLTTLFLIAVVVLAAQQVWTRRVALEKSLASIPLLELGISWVLAGASVFVTMLAWREVLAALGARLSVPEGSRIFFLGQLGKYLPGSVWPLIAQAELARRTGTKRSVTVAANVVAVAASLTVGIVLGSGLLPFISPHVFDRFWWLLLTLPVLLACLHPRLITWGLNRLLTLARRAPLPEDMDPRLLLRAIGLCLLSWLLLGAHICVLAAALSHHLSFEVFAASVGGMALATAAGLLFLPAPAGVGVREVVLTLALSPIVTTDQALSIALLSRVALIFVDLVLGLAQVLLTRLKGADVTPSQPGRRAQGRE